VDNSLFLQQTLPTLSKTLRVDLFEIELSFIKQIEKTMDPDLLFEEKWNIATSGDRHALARYHSNLLSKKAIKINESISKLSREEYTKLELQLEQYREVIVNILTPLYEQLRLLVNEEDLNFAAPTADNVDFSKLEKGATTVAKGAPSNWTVLGVLNSIGKALTNNYSALGIFQLLLESLSAFSPSQYKAD
jgi:hypothetical protein